MGYLVKGLDPLGRDLNAWRDGLKWECFPRGKDRHACCSLEEAEILKDVLNLLTIGADDERFGVISYLAREEPSGGGAVQSENLPSMCERGGGHTVG